MKQLSVITIIITVLTLLGAASAQTPKVFWIKNFSPGSSDLTDPLIDQTALRVLDELMQDEEIEVTFLGAADEKAWKMDGNYVHKDISEALNDAKRLSRARALRKRYGRGKVGVTHENIAGVKVVWNRKDSRETYTTKVERLEKENANLIQDMAEVKSGLESLKQKPGTNGHNGQAKSDSNFDVTFQAGFWTWQSGSSGSIFSPYLASSVVIGKAAFLIRGGVTPWHSSTPHGNKSESFIYMGARYMKSQTFGFTLGVYRGWEFFTATDDWLFKTTGASAGIVISKGLIEFNPAVTYSNLDSLEKGSSWRLGITLGVGLNIRNILSKH